MSYFDSNEALSLMIKKLDANNKKDETEIDKQLSELVEESIEQQNRPRTVVTYEDEEPEEEEEYASDEELPDIAYGSSLSELIAMVSNKPVEVELDYDDDYILDDVVNVVRNTPTYDNSDNNSITEQHICGDVSEESTEEVPETEEVVEESEEAGTSPREEVEELSVDNETAEEENETDEIDPDLYDGIVLNGKPMIEMEK